MMKNGIGACVFLTYALLFSGQPVTADEDPMINCDQGDSCALCYKILVSEVLSRDTNVYNLQQAFFAPSGSVPVFVTVRYRYLNESNFAINTDSPVIYFWSPAIYFFFHPVKIFQFTSLLFSDPSLQTEILDLTLDVNCINASEEHMTLLTQRLKLYAMHQKFTAPIDNTYHGRSYSSATLKVWYKSNKGTDILALVSQIFVPGLMMLYITFFFIYVLELKPHEIGRDIENELTSKVKKIRAKADAKLLIKITISFLFHTITFIADSLAFVEYGKLSDEIHDYYYAAPRCFWSIPIVMILFDGLSFLVIYTIVPIVALRTKKWYRLAYCMLSPLACIFSHSYHIIFAFINNPYHATSILILYAMILFVFILGFQQVYHFIHYFWDKCFPKNDPPACDDPGEPESAKESFARRCCRNIVTFFCFIFLFLITGLSIGLSLALLTLLPITNAIDDAPNRLYVIYQASVTFFAALIAFQVIFRHNNSPLGFLIKAKEMCEKKELKALCENGNSWMEKSEKEREIYLVQKVILAIENLANGNTNANQNTDTEQPNGVIKPNGGNADIQVRGCRDEKQPLLS